VGDPGQFQFPSATVSGAESSSSVTLTITRTNGKTGSVTVNYATSDGVGKAGTDYTAASGTLTFADGETSKTITIPVLDDGGVGEADPTFQVTLSSPSAGATLGSTASTTVTLFENDPGGVLQFSAAAYSVNENAGTVTITITRTNGVGADVSVGYQTSSGTAKAGINYVSATSGVLFAAGETSKTFTIGIINDNVIKGRETFKVSLISPFGASLGQQSTTEVIIHDADGTANQRYVADLYWDILGRAVDSTGLAVWTAAIDSGASRSDVALAIENSVEYRTSLVQNLYQNLLHRAADPVGLAGWLSLLSQGASIINVEADIIGSGEYINNRGSGTVLGFLSAVYNDVLGRALDPSGQVTWGTLLAMNVPPSQVALDIIDSTESITAGVQSFYTHFLNRPADSFGLNSFVDAIQHGVHAEQVVADILGSDEYFSQI
jgi:hypothetical protein